MTAVAGHVTAVAGHVTAVAGHVTAMAGHVISPFSRVGRVYQRFSQEKKGGGGEAVNNLVNSNWESH